MSQHLVVSVEKGRWNTTMKPMFTESPLSPRHCSWNVSYFSYLPVKLEALRVHLFSSVQSLSRVQLFATPWTAAHQAFLSITNFWSLLKLMSIESVIRSNHLILCCPLLLWPLTFPSIGVFSNETVLRSGGQSNGISASTSNEHSGLISFRMDGLNLLAVQGTLKSPLQHHSSKASILQCSAFFTVQLSHPYMSTGKNRLD